MGQGISHRAGNINFGPPPGESERVGSLLVYATQGPSNRVTSLTSEWELSDEEIEEIVRTKRIMVNFMGSTLLAHFVAPESVMRNFVTDFGPTWKAV